MLHRIIYKRKVTEAVFLGDTETSASLAAIEAAVGEDRQCPHCGMSPALEFFETLIKT